MLKVRLILDNWAHWSRAYAITLGYPKRNVLVNAIMYGTGIRMGYRSQEMPPMPDEIKRVDVALLELRRVNPNVYQVIRSSHLLGKGDKQISTEMEVSSKTCQRWRNKGYDWLADTLHIVPIDRNVH